MNDKTSTSTSLYQININMHHTHHTATTHARPALWLCLLGNDHYASSYPIPALSAYHDVVVSCEPYDL
jgi:hypothetical protein